MDKFFLYSVCGLKVTWHLKMENQESFHPDFPKDEVTGAAWLWEWQKSWCGSTLPASAPSKPREGGQGAGSVPPSKLG